MQGLLKYGVNATVNMLHFLKHMVDPSVISPDFPSSEHIVIL